MSLRFRPTSVLCVLSVIALACGKHSPAAPEAAAPAAPAGAAAAPAPAATPVNAKLACGMGPGIGDGSEASCPRTSANFLPEVDAAINRVVAKRPELFDLGDVRGPGGYFVKNVDEYYRQVVQELGNARLCAMVDGGGEIAVKATNDYNDQYHIMISSGYVRRGDASYRATCEPAWF
jgi:hypothetical protein